jgi:RimJ/RimL family protein N-acetyltransferase
MLNTITTDQGIIIIRQAVQEDAARLRELRIEALSDSPVAFTADPDAARAEPAELWAERLRGYEPENQGMICVAEAGERLVGMCGFYRGNRPKTRHSGMIWGVFVSPDWRGLRIADHMIKKCLDWGQAHGVVAAKLGVNTSNIPAIRCYTRCGFSLYGIEPKAIYYDGVYYDELLMAVQTE